MTKRLIDVLEEEWGLQFSQNENCIYDTDLTLPITRGDWIPRKDPNWQPDDIIGELVWHPNSTLIGNNPTGVVECVSYAPGRGGVMFPNMVGTELQLISSMGYYFTPLMGPCRLEVQFLAPHRVIRLVDDPSLTTHTCLSSSPYKGRNWIEPDRFELL